MNPDKKILQELSICYIIYCITMTATVEKYKILLFTFTFSRRTMIKNNLGHL